MDSRSERIAHRFELPLLFAALLTIPAIVIEASSDSGDAQVIASVLNWMIWLAFTTEVVVMLSVVPDRRRWARRHPLEIAIVILTPPFGPAALQSARVLRLLRLMALAKLMREVLSPEGLKWAGFLTLLVVLASAGAFAAIEDGHHDDPINLWDGLWWATTTVTTVGYGDLSPATDAGKVIAMVVMVSGIGFVAMLTAAVAERFVRRDVQHVEHSESHGQAAIVARLDDISERLARLEARL
jgi:voltage-gated potassium channel